MKEDNQLEKFLQWLTSRGFSSCTVRSYKYDIRGFLTHLEEEEVSLEDVTEGILSEYITKRTALRMPSTIKRLYASIPKFFQYLAFKMIIPAYPFVSLDFDRPKIKDARPAERSYTAGEMECIMETTDRQKDPLLAKLMIELLQSSSLRAEELLSLSYNSLDLKSCNGSAVRKGGERWPIKFSKESAVLLDLWYAENKEAIDARGGKVFGITYKVLWTLLRKIGRDAGISVGLRPHKLRHYWTTKMVEKKVDRGAIVKLGGWKSDSMLRRYSHEDEEFLTKEYDKSQEQIEAQKKKKKKRKK